MEKGVRLNPYMPEFSFTPVLFLSPSMDDDLAGRGYA